MSQVTFYKVDKMHAIEVVAFQRCMCKRYMAQPALGLGLSLVLTWFSVITPLRSLSWSLKNSVVLMPFLNTAILCFMGCVTHC